MNTMTINAEKAIDIAKETLTKAGHYTSVISEVTKQNNQWKIVATTFSGKLKIMLDGSSGEVLEITNEL